jgi:hypothetical protein
VITAKMRAAMLAAMVATSCGTHEIFHKDVPSPDGAYVAGWVQNIGGGAAGFVGTHVCLHTPHFLFFVRGCVFGATDLIDIEVRWRSPRDLEIAYPSTSNRDVTTMLDRWRDVKIRFVPQPLHADVFGTRSRVGMATANSSERAS